MKFQILVLIIAATIIASCKPAQKTSTDGAKTTKEVEQKTADGFTISPSGLKYKIHQQGTGKKPKAGDRVEVHYTGKLTNDTVFDSSIPRGEPLPFYIGKNMVIKGWDEGISMLNEGGKAQLVIPPYLGYGQRAMGKIPANSTLIFDVELVKVVPKVTPVPFDTKGKDTIKLASGLKYIIVEEGKGRIPFSGANVTAHYTGYLEDGKIFDSSVERGQPFKFPVGKGKVIKAWDEAFSILKTGTKARLLVPSKLGYNERGFGKLIPPNSNLIFDIELIEYN